MKPRTREEEMMIDNYIENNVDAQRETAHEQDDIAMQALTDLEMSDFEREYNERHPED